MSPWPVLMLRLLTLWAIAGLGFDFVAAIELTIPEAQLRNGAVAGVPFGLSWTGADGPIGLLLRNGVTNSTILIIAFDLRGQTTYAWTPPLSLPNGVYTIEIGDTTSSPMYSDLFNLTGGGISSSNVVSSTSTRAPSPTTRSIPLIEDQTTTTVTLTPSSSYSRHHTHTWTRTHTPSGATPSSSLSSPSSSSYAASPVISYLPCGITPGSPSACTLNTHTPVACTSSCMRNLNDTRVTHALSGQAVTASSTNIAQALTVSSTPSPGMPQSTKVAIGVGAAVGLNIIVLMGLLAFWHRKRIMQQQSERKEKEEMYMSGAVPGSSPPSRQQGQVVPLSAEERAKAVELDAGWQQAVHEIDGRRKESVSAVAHGWRENLRRARGLPPGSGGGSGNHGSRGEG